ncbi:hypothetical protein [Erythrobacter sp.]|uniref:hypothetical protein n=1 Tax=Erythrobacter sp. TaxID=1042 RepID=UPI003C755920
MNRPLFALAVGACLTAPLAAKDSLGIYSSWGAFRDDGPVHCYAIAKPERERDSDPFASIATYPARGVERQVHLRLSRSVSASARVRLTVGSRQFDLAANGRNAWGRDGRMDAAIVAAMRSAPTMRVAARDVGGVRFVDRYDLAGAATAIDAATVGCANRKTTTR